jgi:hypothetical protein
MKKNSKFNGIFWVGIIPIIFIAVIIIMITSGILYSVFRTKPDHSVTENTSVKQDPPKPEKVYIHDTVYIKVPQVCHKEHVENKPVSAEQLKDANDTNNADHSIN